MTQWMNGKSPFLVKKINEKNYNDFIPYSYDMNRVTPLEKKSKIISIKVVVYK